jgi:hypothetical protein
MSRLALFLGFLTACAGPNAISGTVTDRSGRPVDRAIVSLDPGNIELVTDREGRFVIDYLRDEHAERVRLRPKTEYSLEVFKAGFHVETRAVPYRRGPLDVGELALTAETLEVQHDGRNLLPTLQGERTTGASSTYEGQ